VVFALTNTTTPTSYPVGAVANGNSWVVYSLPSMTDGSETPTFIASGILSNANANVVINSHSIAAVCFNSVGRLVNNTTNVATVTGGANCSVPTAHTPPAWLFDVSTSTGDRPLEVQVGLGGQVHMCDPSLALSSANPEGCAS
jgi:type IV fimbrial biogenesis protein FimT